MCINNNFLRTVSLRSQFFCKSTCNYATRTNLNRSYHEIYYYFSPVNFGKNIFFYFNVLEYHLFLWCQSWFGAQEAFLIYLFVLLNIFVIFYFSSRFFDEIEIFHYIISILTRVGKLMGACSKNGTRINKNAIQIQDKVVKTAPA